MKNKQISKEEMQQLKQQHIVLSLKNITRTFKIGDLAIQAVKAGNFDVSEKDFIFIVGPSGSGKTTLVNMLVGLDRPSSGNIYMKINGQGYKDITQFSRSQYEAYRRFNVSIIFQFFNLIPILTALENVELTAELMNFKEPESHAIEILEKLGLQKIMHKYPYEISGGDQQRVAIARALVKKTPMIFADEPTGNLDSNQSVEVIEFMKQINKDFNIAFIIVSHNLELANKFADRLIKIQDGALEVVK